MEKTIIRDVRDIAGPDRKALEHALGETLRDNQRLIVQLLTVADVPEPEPTAMSAGDIYADLPEWCDVFAGLSDKEITDVERTASQRLNLIREPS